MRFLFPLALIAIGATIAAACQPRGSAMVIGLALTAIGLVTLMPGRKRGAK
jgi:hypothetical protein